MFKKILTYCRWRWLLLFAAPHLKQTNKQTVKVRSGHHRQGSPSSWSSPRHLFEYRANRRHGWGGCWLARNVILFVCWLLHSSTVSVVWAQHQALILPTLLDPGVSGGEYRQNKSCIAQDPQFCWGKIFMVGIFDAPLFWKKKKNSRGHMLHPSEGQRGSGIPSVPSSKSEGTHFAAAMEAYNSSTSLSFLLSYWYTVNTKIDSS